MRYFWSLIAALVLITAGLNTARRSAEGASQRAPNASAEPAQTLARAERPRRPEPEPESNQQAAGQPASDAPVPLELKISIQPDTARADPPEVSPEAAVANAPAEEAAEQADEPVAEPAESVAESKPKGEGKSLDALLGVIAEAKEALPPAEATEPRPEPAAAGDRTAPEDEQTAQTVVDPMLEAAADAGEQAAVTADTGPVGPAFSVRADGSIEVEGAGVIAGDGSHQRPFVIDWQVLRSVARDYNPKQGQDQIPDWVNQLDGKVVRVEGNTLLPVVAASTDELLVMQNPWDGCCVGVPPTPYDAIEVKLSEMTRMGNSPTGFGMVEGTLKVDPYIVQGWLLGLYVIENASFESAAGMTLPGL